MLIPKKFVANVATNFSGINIINLVKIYPFQNFKFEVLRLLKNHSMSIASGYRTPAETGCELLTQRINFSGTNIKYPIIIYPT